MQLFTTLVVPAVRDQILFSNFGLLEPKDILHFVTYITIQPTKNDVLKFIKSFDENLIRDLDNKLSVFGPVVKYINLEEVPSNIFIHHDHETFVEQFLNQPVFA